MRGWRRSLTVASVLLALLPATAAAQSAGDEQYADPFGEQEQQQSEPQATATPAPAAPAQAPAATPAPAPASAAPAPAPVQAAQLPAHRVGRRAARRRSG